MSRAFVKEQDGAEAFDELPEKLISPHPNYVTRRGLELIEAEVQRLSKLYAEAQASGERAALAETARDLRYWTARRSSAEVVDPRPGSGEVLFGATVTLEREDGKRQTWRIVGEDEADPKAGTLSYVSPLARALAGKSEGDAVEIGGRQAEIIAIA